MSRWLLARRLLPVLLSVMAAALLLPARGDAPKGKMYALLVGINRYDHPKLAKLKYAENDATDLAVVLQRAGYEVTLLTGSAKAARLRPTKANIEARLKEVLRRKELRGGTVLLAFAGHGVQFAGKDDAFFCPQDARPFADKTDTLVSLTAVSAEMDRSFAGVKLMLVDACRNDPASGRSIDVDTAPRPPRGIAALFSCSSGERAFETEKLGKGHGVFFHFVLEGLKGKAKNSRGAVTWHRLAEYVTEQVSEEVPRLIGGGARQTPHEVFEGKGRSPVLLAVTNEPPREITNSIGMKLVLIPTGKFMMGSPASEKDREPFDKGNEEQHEVEITQPFYLGVTEVTQKQYRQVMGTGGGKASVAGMDTNNFPVERVSWEDAQAFLKKLSELPEEKKKGRKYRLPTEAEWEYSCRSGAPSDHPFHFGPSLSSTQANFDGNYPYGGAAKGPWLKRTCAVGSYPANRFGLRDMHGNVWEWCADWYDKDYYKSSPRKDPKGPATGTARVVRGGSWFVNGRYCRAAGRSRIEPGRRYNDVGFRVAVSLPRRTP
jgi:formylglycine-generating enzyme required for sulfatase activity